MTTIEQTTLRTLDPELADWWSIRRNKAWSEVGLTRPHTSMELRELSSATSKTAATALTTMSETLRDFGSQTSGAAQSFRGLTVEITHDPPTIEEIRNFYVDAGGSEKNFDCFIILHNQKVTVQALLDAAFEDESSVDYRLIARADYIDSLNIWNMYEEID